MRALSAIDILEAWEEGEHERPLVRALTLLSRALPGSSWDELCALRIGQRDALLLSLRARTFGEQAVAYAECPACGERLELPLSIAEILAGSARPGQHADGAMTLERLGYKLHLRLPDSRDLAAIADRRDAEGAAEHLFLRCVLAAERDGIGLAPAVLPAEVRTEIDRWMAEQDPLAEVRLSSRCTACAHAFLVTLDIVEFLWTEVAARAMRLTLEVYTLASAFGWHEHNILTMSPVRRQRYLELVRAP